MSARLVRPWAYVMLLSAPSGCGKSQGDVFVLAAAPVSVPEPAPTSTAVDASLPADDTGSEPMPLDAATPPAPEMPDAGTSDAGPLPEPIVSYTFDNGSGSIIASGMAMDMLNLEILDPETDTRSDANIVWNAQSLTVSGPTRIITPVEADTVTEACIAAEELAVSVWVTPSRDSYDYRAPIVTLTQQPEKANFTVVQGDTVAANSDLFIPRSRTNETEFNGLPWVVAEARAVAGERTHIGFSHAADGEELFFFNGRLVATRNLAGSYSMWGRDHYLALANERTTNNPWFGTYHEVTIFCDALTEQHFRTLHERGGLL